MFRLLSLVLALCLPNLATALCNGPSFWDSLTPAQRSELQTEAAQTRYGAGNYWELTRDGKTLHILGTMHLPDPRHATILATVRRDLLASDLLLVEATLDDQTEMQVYMSQNPDVISLTSGPTLPDLLDAPTWDAVRNAATARGLPGFMVAKMRPWFVSLNLAIPPCAMAAMVSGQVGLDNMLITTAQDAAIPVAPLEPWEDMFAILSSGTLDEQIDALKLALIPADAHDALIVTLVDFYFDEQSAISWHLTDYTRDLIPDLDDATFDAQMAQMEQLLLVERNRNWIPVIEQAATTHERIFIGFGAAHLFGEHGVLAMLETNGWTVTRK